MANVENLTEIILATGALGTASFGVVEALKSTAAVGEAGFNEIPAMLCAVTQTLERAHGPRWQEVYRGLYRGDQGEFVRLLRQGVRVGLASGNARAVGAELFGTSAPEVQDLVTVAGKTMNPAEKPTEAELHALGRYELAADARIDAALAIAKQRYASVARTWAMGCSFGIAVATAVALYAWDVAYAGSPATLAILAVVVGVAAVPIAPIAKDVASGINAAARALKARG